VAQLRLLKNRKSLKDLNGSESVGYSDLMTTRARIPRDFGGTGNCEMRGVEIIETAAPYRGEKARKSKVERVK